MSKLPVLGIRGKNAVKRWGRALRAPADRLSKGILLMKANSRLIILSVAVLAALLCVGAALASPRASEKPEQQSVNTQPQNPQEPDDSEARRPVPDENAKYTVTAYEGRLAVYLTAQMDAPQYVTDVEVSTLPLADREALQTGIPIYNEEELTSILEDYSS